MARTKTVVGLDIGTTKVCAVVAAKDEFGKINILGVGKASSEGISRANVANINKTVDAIREAVAEAEHTSGVKIKGVNVGISGEHISCIKSNAEVSVNSSRIVNQSDVQRFIDKGKKINLAIDRRIIHAIPQEFVVDDQDGVIDPVGMAGISMRGSVYLVTGYDTKIRNIELCIQKAGLVGNGLTFEPIASALAVMKENEKRSGVVLIDIGGGTTDIAVYTRGIIRYSSVIKIAAMDVTNDIIYGLKTLQETAEKLKIEYGCAYSRDLIKDEEVRVQGIEGRTPKIFMKSALTNIIESRMTEILEIARDELKRNVYYNYINAGAILTGGGSLINGVQSLAQEVLGMDVRIGYPEGIAGGVTGEINSPIFATSMGLVIKAFQDVENAEAMHPAENEREEKPPELHVPQPKPEPILATPNHDDEQKSNKFVGRLKDWFNQI
jgi:cell division protein FtsA